MRETFAFLEGPRRDTHVEARRRAFVPSRDPAAYHAVVTRLMASAHGRRTWRVPALLGDSGDLLASMDLHETHVRLGNRKLKLGGIACFNVREDLRRRGLGWRLMDEFTLESDEFPSGFARVPPTTAFAADETTVGADLYQARSARCQVRALGLSADPGAACPVHVTALIRAWNTG